MIKFVVGMLFGCLMGITIMCFLALTIDERDNDEK